MRSMTSNVHGDDSLSALRKSMPHRIMFFMRQSIMRCLLLVQTAGIT
jgi:hypothetical protein